jgi:3-hydroxybutyryl-CoA dehydrogenase
MHFGSGFAGSGGDEKMDIKVIAVIGAGIMGGGIAQAAAQSGYDVLIEDVDGGAVSRCLTAIKNRLEIRIADGKIRTEERDLVLSHIRTTTSLEDCRGAGLVIEAVTEREEAKKEIFQQLDALCSPETILASNTSSIPITRLAGSTRSPGRVIGMHFMNPAYIMKLVEIVRGYRTSDETIAAVKSVSEKMGKVPVVVMDFPGFVSNRVLMPMINEAIFCLQEGVASKEGIDTIMKFGANHPMGPLELADFIGLDTCLEILDILRAGIGEKFSPCPLLRKMVGEGKLGRKSGEGFYDYR